MGVLRKHLPLHASVPASVGWVNFGKRTRLQRLLEPHLNTTVYRYATLAEALLLIRCGKWSFVRPTEWSDNYEKHVSKELFADGSVFQNFPGYVKCISFEYSSEAMWRTYASTAGLVRLSWTLRSLVQQLDEADWDSNGKVYFGVAHYMEPHAVRREVSRIKTAGAKLVTQQAMRALMMKRAGFAFENEIRVCFFPTRPDKADVRMASGIACRSVKGLLVDPYLKPWQAEQLVDLFRTELGVPFPVSQSEFDAPVHVLPL